MIKINNNIMFEIANFKDLMGLSDLSKPISLELSLPVIHNDTPLPLILL